jgi:hypothetical protein
MFDIVSAPRESASTMPVFESLRSSMPEVSGAFVAASTNRTRNSRFPLSEPQVTTGRGDLGRGPAAGQ